MEWLRKEMASLVPDVSYLDTTVQTCVVTTSSTGRPFIDQVDGTGIYLLVAGNGQVAKSADELGRIAANRVLRGAVPDEYRSEDFTARYR